LKSGCMIRGNGGPRTTRTPSLLIRSQMLYPIELWNRRYGLPPSSGRIQSCSLLVLKSTRTITDPLASFFEVVRLRWVLGCDFSQQESHWCITLCITNVPVDTATGLSNLLVLLEGNLS
jgi:hypothetical protein